MNKRIGLIALVLLAVPACQKQTTTEIVTSTKNPSHGEKIGESRSKPQTKPIFDEDVEGYILEDQGNAFSAPAEETEEEDINVVEHDVDDTWIDKRLAQAQEYGFKTIYFKFDDYTVRPDQKTILDYNLRKVADLVKKGKTIVAEGHACRFGGDPVYNMHLSEKRAHSVADYFVEHGVLREKLKVVGRGNEMCIVPEGDMEQQAPNRRVEFYVLESEKA
jgi:outer membrane protein OmpA-like peptidoglycan-associated protein